jgi:3-dehydroquinate synthase
MSKFLVNDIEFVTLPLDNNEILVSSHPSNYNVVFKNFSQIWNDDDFVLVDSNIQKIYSIKHSNLFTVDALESNKTIEQSLELCEFLLCKNFSKKNTLHVIGGGIVQDIGAFTAKIFKRGITWKYYPTTLLSQCDSCIGGKTAMNFKNYKNQLALFSAPIEVVIDSNFLSSLSQSELDSGNGEIVKLFITGGNYYIDNYDNWSLEDKIKQALSIKKTIIEYDEFEFDVRKVLNYGHTFGHIIESLTNYKISHGKAIILGMYIVSKLFDTNKVVVDFLSKFIDQDDFKLLDPDKLFSMISTDKKTIGSKICFVHSPDFGITNFIMIEIDDILLGKIHEIFAD